MLFNEYLWSESTADNRDCEEAEIRRAGKYTRYRLWIPDDDHSLHDGMELDSDELSLRILKRNQHNRFCRGLHSNNCVQEDAREHLLRAPPQIRDRWWVSGLCRSMYKTEASESVLVVR